MQLMFRVAIPARELRFRGEGFSRFGYGAIEWTRVGILIMLPAGGAWSDLAACLLALNLALVIRGLPVGCDLEDGLLKHTGQEGVCNRADVQSWDEDFTKDAANNASRTNPMICLASADNLAPLVRGRLFSDEHVVLAVY